MKYTVCGFNQEKAIGLGLDVTDLLILRWIVDFSPKMSTKVIDDQFYYWVKYQSILEDLPILKIGKDMLYKRLKKMVNAKVLVNNIEKNSTGTYTYYGFGENYMPLVKNSDPHPEKNLTQNNPSTKEYNKLYSYIVEYLNKQTGFNYRASSQKTQRFIHARLEEGFTQEDFEKVIDNKVKDWKGTDYEKFLRPETLFGTKFEGYLQMSKNNKKYNVMNDYDSYIKSLEGEK